MKNDTAQELRLHTVSTECASDCHTVYISVGSNMGDIRGNCRQGISAVAALKDTRLKRQSRVYETEPVDFKDQNWFLNCVVEFETAASPVELLDRIKEIELAAGRSTDGPRFGPRVLDLDIVLYDHLVVRSRELTIPHPRMHKRCFVLKPICDINPNIVHPVLNKTMKELLDSLDAECQQVLPYL